MIIFAFIASAVITGLLLALAARSLGIQLTGVLVGIGIIGGGIQMLVLMIGYLRYTGQQAARHRSASAINDLHEPNRQS